LRRARAKSKPRNPIGFYPTPQPPRGRKEKTRDKVKGSRNA